MINQCNNCAENNCKECLIHRIQSIAKDAIIVQPHTIKSSEHDYSTPLILR